MSLTLVFLLLLLLSSGYCSSSETALFSLSNMQVKTYESSHDSIKRLIATLLKRPKDLLVTVFMLNTLVNILLQNTASHLFRETHSWTLKVGVPLIVTLIFGEIIPKYIGLQNNTTVSYFAAPSINFFQNILKPIRLFTVKITEPISKLMFFFLKKEKTISREELQHALKTSEERGILTREEKNLVTGYLNLHSMSVKELMCPFEDILYFDLEWPLTKLLYLFIDQQCSRLPVCEHNLQNTLGVITIKQFFLHKEKINETIDLKKILKKPFYIPENTPAKLLLSEFEESGETFALAVDEYGMISGLITKEDLLEVIIGNIVDRRDQKALFTKTLQNEIIASGKLELTEFNQFFQSNLESEGNMVTIGGWVTEQLGEIPKEGTSFQKFGFLFQVLSADKTRIRRLYIRKMEEE
jgi:CBS domain containing-hemolysin-like protein